MDNQAKRKYKQLLDHQSQQRENFLASWEAVSILNQLEAELDQLLPGLAFISLADSNHCVAVQKDTIKIPIFEYICE